MAKHTKQKHRNVGPFKKDEAPVVDEKVRQESVLPVINSLKSINADERSTALSALVGLIEDRNIRHMLLRERLIKIILTNTLSDSSLEDVSQGLGILRNIVLLEGRDPALFLVRENIKFPINSISLKSLSSINAGLSCLDEVQSKIMAQICENVCGLTSAILLSLGELKSFENVLQLGIELVKHASKLERSLTSRCIEAAIEMLYYISESSGNSLLEAVGVEGVKELKEIPKSMQAPTWSTKIYAMGIDINVLVLSGEAVENTVPSVQELSEFLSEVPKSESNSIQVCLELLALLAQTDDLNVVSLLVRNCGSLILESFLSDKTYTLHSVSVLNNIGWSLNALGQKWEAEAEKIYEAVIIHCFNQCDDTDLISSALGLLSATLVQKDSLVETMGFSGLVPHLFSQVEKLFAEKDEDWICLSKSLVLLLTTGKSVAVQLRLIDSTAKLIFSLLESSNDVEAQIDALNALFDLFGDNESPYNKEEYDSKALNEKLESLKPALKRSLKSVPKANETLRGQAIDAVTNMENFIIYKRG